MKICHLFFRQNILKFNLLHLVFWFQSNILRNNEIKFTGFWMLFLPIRWTRCMWTQLFPHHFLCTISSQCDVLIFHTWFAHSITWLPVIWDSIMFVFSQVRRSCGHLSFSTDTKTTISIGTPFIHWALAFLMLSRSGKVFLLTKYRHQTSFHHFDQNLVFHYAMMSRCLSQSVCHIQ